MSTPRVVPGDRRVKTAWTDPEHVRLAEGTPEERVNPKRSERLRHPDLDDWVSPCPHAAARAAIPAPRDGGES